MKRIIFATLVLIIFLIAVTVVTAEAQNRLYTEPVSGDVLIACYPGWPSGWWIADCYGENGGYASLRGAK